MLMAARKLEAKFGTAELFQLSHFANQQHAKTFQLTSRSAAAFFVLCQQRYSKPLITETISRKIPPTVWLHPEHGVVHPHKPGKLRHVSNARSKIRGMRLNDMLLPVPDLANKECFSDSARAEIFTHCKHRSDVHASHCTTW